jgi:hypothetical protein
MDTRVFYPLLIWVFSLPETDFSAQRRVRFLAVLESFLIRRMLTRQTSAGYNKLCITLLQSLSNADRSCLDDHLVGVLTQQSANAREWPSDAKVIDALRWQPMYDALSQSRIRMVFEAIENELRSPKSEEEHCRLRLQIEHIMPQRWVRNWPLGATDNVVLAEQTREEHIHRIGNLTLVNDKLNPALSNSGWNVKAVELGKHSVLHLNKQLLEKYASKPFSESEIEARCIELADAVLRVWPKDTADEEVLALYESLRSAKSMFDSDEVVVVVGLNDPSFYMKPLFITIESVEYEVSNWKYLMVAGCTHIVSHYPDKWESALDDVCFLGKRGRSFGRDTRFMREPMKVSNGYVETHLHSKHMVQSLRKLYEYVGIDLSTVTYTMKPTKRAQNSDPNPSLDGAS